MYDTRSLDVRNQTFDFEKTMGNEGGATNSAPFVIGGGSRRRDCHFADNPTPSILKHLLKTEGNAAE